MHKFLNSKQKLALDFVKGPILILAGAGSGKTRTLTYRIAYLIKEDIAQPENILAVTFTNKAAKEMVERIRHILADQTDLYEEISLPWMGTFHSICLKILKRDGHHNGIPNQFTIYDSTDQVSIVKQVLKELNINPQKVNPRAVLHEISSAKSNLIMPQQYLLEASSYFQELVAKVYPAYQKSLRDNGALDFDDLLMETVLLFENNPQILQKYQDLFHFILIDEYQDTNHVQYKFATLLAAKHKNICVVGDDAQSIYSFRGATIDNILNFEKDYPDAQIITLDQNYRSTQTILDASNHLISFNKAQKRKNLWTENPDGEQIEIYTAYDERDEAKWIATKIAEITNSSTEADQIAILYRTNAQSRNLEEALLIKNIPYRIVGNVRFYDRKEVKDILAYLRIIYNSQDELSTKRVINVPRRGIGPKTVNMVSNLAKSKQQSLGEFLLDCNMDLLMTLPKGIQAFAAILKELEIRSEVTPTDDLIEMIMNKTGYYEMLNDGSQESQNRVENIKELKSVAQKFSHLSAKDGLASFLDEIALIEGTYRNDNDSIARVTLMTIHSAKGLEFDHIFVAGMEENIFPHSNSKFSPNEMEEERRLAYVALTRARQQLYLTHTKSRLYFGNRTENPASRFITDLPDHLVNFLDDSFSPKSTYNYFDSLDNDDYQEPFLQGVELNPGDKVKHEIFGVGQVIDADDFLIVVKFQAGTKELAKEFVKLEKL